MTNPSVKLTAADKAKALAASVETVTVAAFNAGEGRNNLLSALLVALGDKPNLTLYNAVHRGQVVGLMASALARKGDNRPRDVLTAHCVDRLDNYQGATGTAALRDGMTGRRTDDEEAAYVSARNIASRNYSDAGIKVPTKSGSNSTKGKASPNAKAGKSAKGKAEKADRPTVRTFKSVEELCTYALVQAKAMQGSLNQTTAATKDAASLSPVSEPIAAFLSAIVKAAEGLGIATA